MRMFRRRSHTSLRSVALHSIQCTVLVALLAGCGTRATPVDPPTGVADAALRQGIEPAALVVEPRDGVRPVVRALDRADNTIFLEMYILSDSRIVRALERAAAQGVAVYVLLERHPYGLASQPLPVLQRLRASGVHVRWSRPGFTFTHAKFAVLDDRLAIVSTANFSRSAFSHNREFLIFDRERRDVWSLSQLFRDDWDRLPVQVGDANIVLAPENARRKISLLLRGARRSIDIYGEELSDPGIERELRERARRGVRIRVLLPAPTSFTGRLSFLAPVRVHFRQMPYIHAKMIVIDRREAFVGSENLSATSLDLNREVGVLVRGREVAVLEATFERDWSKNG